MKQKIAGVDGCSEGWLVATSTGWPKMKPRLIVCDSFEDVILATADYSVTVIDVPIGLREGELERICDVQAKAGLAQAGVLNTHSRIFRPPPRSALQVFEEMRHLSRPQRWAGFKKHVQDVTGKSPTMQAFDITDKIKQVDDSMTSPLHPGLQNKIVEYHPEPAWRRIANNRTLQSKHTATGLLQRMTALREAGADWLYELMDDPVLVRVKLDDLLDAVVGLAVAAGVPGTSSRFERNTGSERKLNRYPNGAPEPDEHQLRMEIWY